MSRALIVTTDGNPLKFNFWCLNYDKFNLKNEVDKVYVPISTYLSSDFKKEFKRLCGERNFKLIINEDFGLSSHGKLLNLALDQVLEDYVCFLEDDIWILKENILNEKFKLLETNQYKMVSSPRSFSPRFFENAKEINNFYEKTVNDPTFIISEYWLWPCWFFIKTNTLKELQEQYIDEISQYNFADGNYSINPRSNFSVLKKYNTFIPNWLFFTCTYVPGSKLSLIDPRYTFEYNHSDEIFQIVSFLLIKKFGYENCKFERQLHLTNGDAKFDFEHQEVTPWSLDWIHANASSGVNGMYGAIRDEKNVPIYPPTYHNCFSTSIIYSEMQVTDFCYGMNLSFVRSHNHDSIMDFKNDYKKYILYHTNKESRFKNVNYISDVMSANVI